jgi:hypothetical protein
MAQSIKKSDTEENLPVVSPTAGLPNGLADLVEGDAGQGISQAQEDNLVPLIYVLQTNSPQCNKRDDRYVDGAEPGDIWLRGAPSPVVKGADGFLFQPCHFVKDWVEWVPRDSGGGFVGRHDERPANAREVRDPKKPSKVVYITPDGHEVKETRNHMGYAITSAGPMPYAIPLTSSGHTVSREWMGLMGRQRLPNKPNVQPPSWALYYRLRTKMRHNADGDWFVLSVENAGPDGTPLWVPTADDYQRGKALHDAFTSGSKQMEHEQTTSAPSGVGGFSNPDEIDDIF